MTQAECRFPTQVEEDRREAFNRHDYGFPYCGWPYLNRYSKERRIPADIFAPYADPITGGMRPLRVPSQIRREKEKEERREVAKKVDAYRQELLRNPPPRTSEMDPVTVMASAYRVRPAPTNHAREIKLKAHSDALGIPVEQRAIPERLMVDRGVYLGHIRDLMREWGLTSDVQFNIYREQLIRHALNRMELL